MVIDVTDATFETEVIERSRRTPVVVDVWAPWCGPCRTLGPIIEAAVADTGGQVVLAKVNADENPQVSQALRVQGIPAVFAFVDAKVTDQFVGAQPDTAVRAFVDSLVPSPEERQVAELVALGDEASLRAALELVPDHVDAVPALAEILIDDDRGAEALELLARRPETPEIRQLVARARTGDVGGDDEIEAELNRLLPQVKADDEARQSYVDLLDRLGPDDPRTTEYRKALTTQLY